MLFHEWAPDCIIYPLKMLSLMAEDGRARDVKTGTAFLPVGQVKKRKYSLVLPTLLLRIISHSWNLAQNGHCLTGSPSRHKTPLSKTTFQVPAYFSKSKVLFLHLGYLLHWCMNPKEAFHSYFPLQPHPHKIIVGKHLHVCSRTTSRCHVDWVFSTDTRRADCR